MWNCFHVYGLVWGFAIIYRPKVYITNSIQRLSTAYCKEFSFWPREPNSISLISYSFFNVYIYVLCNGITYKPQSGCWKLMRIHIKSQITNKTAEPLLLCFSSSSCLFLLIIWKLKHSGDGLTFNQYGYFIHQYSCCPPFFFINAKTMDTFDMRFLFRLRPPWPVGVTPLSLNIDTLCLKIDNFF